MCRGILICLFVVPCSLALGRTDCGDALHAVSSDWERHSIGSLSVLSGASLSFGGGVSELHSMVNPNSELKLELDPDHPAVIGRQTGIPPYLDPKYQSNTTLPGGGNVVNGASADISVSRAHFMLRSNPRGIVLINGVPKIGGGIRPPRNGTYLLTPVTRPMREAEEFLIESGTNAKIRLPNGTDLLINAE